MAVRVLVRYGSSEEYLEGLVVGPTHRTADDRTLQEVDCIRTHPRTVVAFFFIYKQ